MPEDVQVPKNSQDIGNNEISINHISTQKGWNRREIIVNNIFAYNVTLNFMHKNEDLELRIVEQCRYKKLLAKMERSPTG